MRDQILRFLKAIDETLAEQAEEGDRLDLYLIGKAALILFHYVGHGSATTRDVDVVQISQAQEPLLRLALQLFGEGSRAVATYGLYLEAVQSGLPPMPGAFRSRCRPFEAESYRVLRVHQLDVRDLAVSKLRRFAPKDRQDIQELCDKGLLRPEELESAFESAFRWTTDKDGDDSRDGAREALRSVTAYLQGDIPRL
jgi:hypothetical protein